MKRRIVNLLLFGVALLAPTACKKPSEKPIADVEMGELKHLTMGVEIETPSGTHQQMLRIGDGKMRRDDKSNNTSSILSFTGVVVLDHQTKTYQTRINASDFSTGRKSDEAQLLQSIKLQFTGNTDIISGWNVREFVVVDTNGVDEIPAGAQSRMTVWIADEFPFGQAIQRLIEQVYPDSMLAAIEKSTGKKFELPGFAIRTEVFRAGGLIARITYTTITHGELESDIFEIPQDYLQIIAE